MRLIVLTGASNSGKTGTLNLVYDYLISKQGWKSTNKELLGGNPNDFSDIIVSGKRKIAFYTMGDYSRKVRDAISNYNTLDCDILICACNNRFTIPFRHFERYDNLIVRKEKIADETLFDTEHKRIFDMIIDSIIKMNYLYFNCNTPTSDTDIICCESCKTKHYQTFTLLYAKVKGTESCKGCGVQLLKWDGESVIGEPILEKMND
jgi:hypothetical protein